MRQIAAQTKGKKMRVTMDSVKDSTELSGHKFEEFADRIKITTNTLQIVLKFHDYVNVSKKLRVFSDGETAVDFAEAYEMASSRSSHMKGVDAETDKLFATLNRKVVKNKKALINEAIESVYVVNQILRRLEIKFDKKAGCGMCPCSPGFIADTKDPVVTTVKSNSTRGEWTSTQRIASISIDRI
tara:strand:+ start:796 stop:1350 length:555 start_codon:yes stop_codon:yes gene_type:complete